MAPSVLSSLCCVRQHYCTNGLNSRIWESKFMRTDDEEVKTSTLRLKGDTRNENTWQADLIV